MKTVVNPYVWIGLVDGGLFSHPLTRILNTCCNVFVVHCNLVKGKTRKREVVECRHAFCYIARKHFPKAHSLKKVGYFIGRDHSSIIHACRSMLNLIDIEENIKDKIEEIEKILNLKS